MIGFGTGGWRAVIGEEFTKANVQLLTAALARKMKDEGTQGNGFVIGYDRRFLSVEAAKWAAEVMAGEGIACKLVSRGCPDNFVPIANPEFLYARNGMDADGLYEAMKAMF